MKLTDYTEQKFGRWVVTASADRPAGLKSKGRFWSVKCECGAVSVVSGDSLLRGFSTSCGCRRQEEAVARRLLPNNRGLFNNLRWMYKHNAIRRGLKWELTGEEFDKLIVKPCIYCGSDLLGVFRKTENNSSKKERVLYYNGIDRVDNSRGYVSGNVVPCCKFCNRAKKDSTEAEFTAYLKRVANFIKGTMQ